MWEVKDFTLFSSQPSLEGSTYTVELRESLNACAPEPSV